MNKIKRIIGIIGILFLIYIPAYAMRSAGPHIEPVIHNGIGYFMYGMADYYGSDGIYSEYLVACEAKSNTELWRQKVLWKTTIYKVLLPRDIEQDLFFIEPVSLELVGNILTVKTEKGTLIKVDINTHEIIPPNVVYNCRRNGFWYLYIIIGVGLLGAILFYFSGRGFFTIPWIGRRKNV
jgi:hypothetical protein